MKPAYILAASVVAALTGSASATPHATITPVYMGSLDASFNSLGMLDLTQPQPAADLHQFDLQMTVTGAAADEDFRLAGFSLVMQPGLTDSGYGYSPNNPVIDINGPLPGGMNNTFSQNADIGSDPMDLQNIFVAQTNAAVSKAAQVGEGTPFTLGTVFISWDGHTPATLSVAMTDIGFWLGNSNGQGTVLTYSDPTNVGLYSASGAPVQFGAVPVPEPASLGLLGLGALALLRRRR